MFGGTSVRLGESGSPSSADSPDSEPWCPSGCGSECHSRGWRCCWARQKSSRSSGLAAQGKGPSCPQLCGPLPGAPFPSSAQAQRRRWGPFSRPGSAQWTSVPELAIGPGLQFTWATSSSRHGAATKGIRVTASSSQHQPSCLRPVGDTVGDTVGDSTNARVPSLPAGTLESPALVQLPTPSP